MAYDSRRLSRQVETCLLTRPRITLAALAQQLRVERHTVEWAVREATGNSFRRLQAKTISRRAVELMHLVPSLSIKEIAFLLGYKSRRAFSRFFKKAYGSTPTAVRVGKRAKPARSVP